ncbi:hypothetical protein ASF40_19565 [Microbacterium sp. Leaf288]|nr:hypothetical protein ASF40_19565 [Microbacterium sp. Leaf288]
MRRRRLGRYRTARISRSNGRVRDGIRVATVHPNGSINARGTIFKCSYPMRGKDVDLACEAGGIMIFDDRGTPVAEHNWPARGVTYISNVKPRGPKSRRCHRCR